MCRLVQTLVVLQIGLLGALSVSCDESCTEIGGTHSIMIHFEPAVTVSEPLVVEYRGGEDTITCNLKPIDENAPPDDNAGCRSCGVECSACWEGNLVTRIGCLPRSSPKQIEIRLLRDGTVVRSSVFTPNYTWDYPNGPKCDSGYGKTEVTLRE